MSAPSPAQTTMPAPIFDAAYRHGFTSARSGPPATAGRIVSYELGTAFDEIAEGHAPLVLLADSAAVVPERALRRAVQLLAGNPALSGLTFGGPAMQAIFGEGGPRAETRTVAQTLASTKAAPSWWTLIRRSHLDFSAGYATPEFLLLDAAARKPLLRLGAAGTELDHQSWAKDLVVRTADLLAWDYARFAARHGAARVPPQFRIEAVGQLATLAPAAGDGAAPAAPKFSVICPVFKPRFLAEMIDSVRRQTWPAWELLIVVDGPPPADLERIRAVLREREGDGRIRWMEQENRGTGPTRRRLGEMATGDYVLSIDDDDMLHEEALATFAAAVAAHPDVPVFRAGARLIGYGDEYLPPRRRLVVNGITNDPFEVTQPWAVRRDALRDLGGFEWDEDLRRAGEDTVLFHKIDAARLPTRLIDRPLYYRRLSAANLSLQFKYEEALAHFENLDRRFRPAEWHTLGRTQEKLDRFQRSTTAYRHARTGQEVVCSTTFFQYRTLGALEDATIDLELTTVCNATCTFCPRGEMPDKRTFMSLDVVRALVAQLESMARPPQVVLCGIGESTLHPHLEEITRLVAGAGSRVSMTTNGARMTVELFHRLVAAGMTSLNFSVNAATAETHARVMKLHGFDKVVRTIQDVIAARDAAHPEVRIQVSCVVCDGNESEVGEFVESWRPRGATQIWLHPLNNRAGLLAGDVKPVDLVPWQRKYAQDPLVVVDVFGHRSDDDGICKIAKSLIFISAEGETRLCAMDYRRQTRYGNVLARRIDETHVDKLLAFTAGRTRELCEGCDFCPSPAAWSGRPAQPAPARTATPPVRSSAPPAVPPSAVAVAATATRPAAKYKGLFCPMPFDYAQIDPAGELYLCCPQTLPRSAGNLLQADLMAQWNSPAAIEMRQSILDGTYRFCSEETCGVLQSGRLLPNEAVTDPRHRRIIAGQITRLDEGPRTVNFSYDRSCNLKCPSCRTDYITASGELRTRVDAIHERVVGPHLRDAERLIITGSGDPFGSRHYLKFLRSFDPAAHPGVRIRLSTNGLLLDEPMWRSVCHDAIDMIDVSIDAATPETYLLNRGGDFARLLDNLRFMASLRRRGALKSFEIHCVVQANNFREMPAFARLGRELDCDMTCFKQIVNWGTFSAEEYARRAVQFPAHPEHAGFLAVLADPLFAHPRVYLHDLSHLRATAAAAPRRPVPTLT